MENDFILYLELEKDLILAISVLPDETIKECEANHLGYEGYFIFTVSHHPRWGGIDILAKAPSIDSALALAELLKDKIPRNQVA